ncbi:hypothetical protein TRFO_34238 [Tritrichomonas foetus]|uniref:Uncharacterized protein n=1 Tax=Tritrichomonas foetus TaxID=1144522 RepID=A0A1J4JP87_9EUKA|nr:hypothetical protein TRFO_34238 [Tritrichomonas foetus]|eukprot:OHS99333.1 hypothetical protein TRFO_34238 [Tritrichomonas foetus]
MSIFKLIRAFIELFERNYIIGDFLMKSHLDRLSQKYADYIEKTIQTTEFLCTLNDENFDERCQFFVNSETSKSETYFKEFLRFSINLCFVWPIQIPFSTRLIKYFHDNQNPSNVFSITKDFVLGDLSHWYFNDSNDDVYIFQLYFIHQLIQFGVFQIADIIRMLKVFFNKKKQFCNQICMEFLYFAPEIETEDPDFFNTLFLFYQRSKSKNLLNKKTLNFFNDFEKYKENNWQLLKENRSRLDCGDDILKSLIDDNPEDFRKSLEKRGESITGYFSNPPLSLFTIFDIKYPFILTSVIFNAVKIFRFLYESGVSLDSTSENGATIAQAASMNPDKEIFDILFKENINIADGMASFSRCFHFDKLQQFKSLYKKYGESELSPTKSTVFVQSVLCLNFMIFKECLKHNVDINQTDGFNETPLSTACLVGSRLPVSILVDLGADVNKGFPLIRAASNGHSQIVEYLLSLDNINVNITNEHVFLIKFMELLLYLQQL